MTDEQIIAVVKDRRIKGWLKQPGFRDYIRDAYDHAAMATATYEGWVREASNRMPGMGDKEFIALGKLLAEIADKMPKRWVKEKVLDADVAKMSEDQLLDFVVDRITAMGGKVILPGRDDAEEKDIKELEVSSEKGSTDNETP